MKKFTALTLCLVLLISLSACAKPSFTVETYPKMGGSLAALPLGEALTAHALDIDRGIASSLLTFEGSTTDNYNALVDGTFDIILAYEPSEQAKAYAEEKGVTWEMVPIGIDALVFITGKNNPTQGLTSEQIPAIYNGEITNWAQVGGPDKKIAAYVRNTDSGSHTLFDLFFDLENYDAIKKEYIVGSMIGLLDAIATYQGTDEALGYTVYYYLTNMEASTLETSKLLAVDGVMPSNDTISSGEYPLSNAFYVVIRSDTPKNSRTRILYDWIASAQGREIAEQENYVVPKQ